MKHPNILYVFSDQQRYDTMGCVGNPIVQTPNLDRLAAEGVCFERAFSSCPICSPYRAQILTGKYAHANGVVDNEYKLFTDQVTLAQALGQAGYATAYIGKWHLGYGPYTEEIRYGFDYMAAYDCQHQYYTTTYYENEDGPYPMPGWAPSGETDLAIRFMREETAPFFLMLSWVPPHWPYDQYPEAYHIYDPQEVDLPPNVPKQMAAFARREIADYYGNVSALDAEMGRLLSWLDEAGLAEDTIVCFSSDHGDHLSSHGYGKPMDMWLHHTRRASKATPYEESIHIPFLLRYPARVAAGGRTDILFNSVDVMPTLLSLTGVDVPAGMQGVDLSHAVLGQGGPEPDSVYLQILGPGWPHRGDWVGYWRGVRTDRWLYARWHGGDVLFYDREADPYEMENLAGRPEYTGVQASLEKRLQRWIAETGDPFDTGARDPETGMLQLGQTFIHEKWNTPRTRKLEESTMSQAEVRELTHRLHDAQRQVTNDVLDRADYDKLGYKTPDGFTVNDTLRMWAWHFWAHHRELILARGRLTDDNPHFHVPHHVRQANEAFGQFVGELACLTDDQLDLRLPGDGRTIREIVEHVLATLESYFADQLERTKPPE
jgi:arylsulfatase A-like enzyme